MHTPSLIERKRDGHAHSADELRALVLGFTRGEVPDYQMAAWLMAVYLRGMTREETALLTGIMAESGDTLDLSGLPRTVDKHSTGGVGDKTSLVVAPMMAACGLTVAKMSGRGLAHTGGTIDKLESIPGWQDQLSTERFVEQARRIGLALVGQSKNLAPADGLLYALRDVTATVPSVPLIASSIMSKKLAAGARSIILDVKVGAGAFMETVERATELAEAMIDIGHRNGRIVRAILTNMDAPLGRAAGNSLEVREAIETLNGGGPDDLRELCLTLCRQALLANGFSGAEADSLPPRVLGDGSALAKLRAFVVAQGGDGAYIDQPERFDVAPIEVPVNAPQSGFLSGLDALAVGRAVLAVGGGREVKGAPIDHGVGVTLLAKPGDAVTAGRPVAVLHVRSANAVTERAARLIRAGLKVSLNPQPRSPLVLKVID